MATNTATNVGIRRNFVTIGDRNFEDDGLTQYYCGHEGLEFLGTQYQVDDALPFDVAATSYSSLALDILRLYWNFGYVYPTT